MYFPTALEAPSLADSPPLALSSHGLCSVHGRQTLISLCLIRTQVIQEQGATLRALD